MAITVNWITGVIYVPKADMALIQTDPFEVRELDLDAFRLTLRDLEDDPDGRPWPPTHAHDTAVTMGGVTYARRVRLLAPYTVTFEDGQYAVNLVGANSNVGDRVNLNQVSIRSANSAGLVQVGGADPGVVAQAVWDHATGAGVATDADTAATEAAAAHGAADSATSEASAAHAAADSAAAEAGAAHTAADGAASEAAAAHSAADSAMAEAAAAHGAADDAAAAAGGAESEATAAKVAAEAALTQATLARKSRTNREELAPGSTGNYVLYDDDGVTPIVTQSVTGPSGEAVTIPAGTPARRSVPV